MSIDTWIAAGGLFLLFITSIVVITRKISESESNLKDLLERKQGNVRAELLLEVDKTRREFGETASAIRLHADAAHLKIQEVELYIRDNYVEIDSFNAALVRIEKSVDRLIDKLDGVKPSDEGHKR